MLHRGESRDDACDSWYQNGSLSSTCILHIQVLAISSHPTQLFLLPASQVLLRLLPAKQS